MKSMTGFGQSKLSKKDYRIEVSVKSLNNKFFDIKFYNHKSFIPLEVDIKKAVKSKIKRGSVEVFILKKTTTDQKEKSIHLNEHLAQNWLRRLKRLDTKLKTKSNIDLDLLLRTNPLILKKDENNVVSKEENRILLEQVNKAIDKCCQERDREGRHLNALIKVLLKKLSQKVTVFRLSLSIEL
ncbi:hypothetical protein N9W41_01240 [bacterium]|nr:hypothetical protein [bacterium]